MSDWISLRIFAENVPRNRVWRGAYSPKWRWINGEHTWHHEVCQHTIMAIQSCRRNNGQSKSINSINLHCWADKRWRLFFCVCSFRCSGFYTLMKRTCIMWKEKNKNDSNLLNALATVLNYGNVNIDVHRYSYIFRWNLSWMTKKKSTNSTIHLDCIRSTTILFYQFHLICA